MIECLFEGRVRVKENVPANIWAFLDLINELFVRTKTLGSLSLGKPCDWFEFASSSLPTFLRKMVKYRYDIGANVEANSPAPTGQTYGKTSKRIFDSVGRLERNSVYVDTTEKSYVRYEYPTNGVQSKTYAPIVDVDGDGNIAEDEVYSESWFDGAGRVRQSRTEHPGSTGGWASSFVEYDILGRVKRQSVPTETNSSYAPAGDDAAGPLWTHLKYDWMGRVVSRDLSGPERD